jgi:hypothetical protein
LGFYVEHSGFGFHVEATERNWGVFRRSGGGGLWGLIGVLVEPEFGVGGAAAVVVWELENLSRRVARAARRDPTLNPLLQLPVGAAPSLPPPNPRWQVAWEGGARLRFQPLHIISGSGARPCTRAGAAEGGPAPGPPARLSGRRPRPNEPAGRTALPRRCASLSPPTSPRPLSSKQQANGPADMPAPSLPACLAAVLPVLRTMQTVMLQQHQLPKARHLQARRWGAGPGHGRARGSIV